MNRVFVFLIFLISFCFVSSLDNQTMISYAGDSESVIGFLGDNILGSASADTSPPQLVVNAPNSGATYTSFNVFFDVDTSEVATCNYSLNGGGNYSMDADNASTSFNDVRVLANGNYVVLFYCVDSYGNLNDSVSVSFSVAVEEESSGGGSSGGGGGGFVPPKNETKVGHLKIDKESFKIRSVIRDTKTREFSLSNIGEESLVVNLRVEGQDVEMANGEVLPFGDFVSLDFDSVEVLAGEEIKVGFRVSVPDSLGVFVGKIILEADGKELVIPITINTQSKETIFDVSSTVIDENLDYGEDVRAQIDLLPVGEKGVDVTLKYTLKDFSGKVYYEESETFYVEDPMSFVLDFPTDKLPRGKYVLGVEMIYLGGFASSSSYFAVGNDFVVNDIASFNFVMSVLVIVLALALIIVILILLVKMRRYKK